MQVTLGGDRLGSGNKNKIALRNYERSTFNLSQRWTSSMAAGFLYPFLCIPAMRGDSFQIDLEAAARTIPTQGPLFGSFKMQVDVFQCPWRLYQAILHNNPTAIGLKMNQVKLPIVELLDDKTRKNAGQFANSSLLKYLGMSGIGKGKSGASYVLRRYINAIPMLAYYDIFKNYYSNKQEENAYVCKPETGEEEIFAKIWFKNSTYTEGDNITLGTDGAVQPMDIVFYPNDDKDPETYWPLIEMTEDQIQGMALEFTTSEEQTEAYNIKDLINDNAIANYKYSGKNTIHFVFNNNWLNELGAVSVKMIVGQTLYFGTHLNLVPFKLKNIDDMRMALLSHNNLGTPFEINSNGGDWDGNSGEDNTGLPYLANIDYVNETNENGEVKQPITSAFTHAGLCVKTYQSDLFNNWINTEWIDGENGIAEITKIAVTDGAFKIDALNLAEKLYNMLNRVAVSGGTYEDWQDAVYTQSPRRHIESPVYLGGMSSEIVFEEIVQTAPAGDTKLGDLGGRGILVKRKGGNVDVKVDEASFIIGIVSITPRLNYTQGNEWYLTDLETMDDLHKPALDGIGFQELIGEQLAWFDTKIESTAQAIVVKRSSIGKVPAWINYMTAVDKAYGDFAGDGDKNFMVLARDYERIDDTQYGNGIADVTTYIDPRKFNYAFAYTELEAQNFWVQIQSDIKARRLMSAKQIPNV